MRTLAGITVQPFHYSHQEVLKGPLLLYQSQREFSVD